MPTFFSVFLITKLVNLSRDQHVTNTTFFLFSSILGGDSLASQICCGFSPEVKTLS